MNLKIVQKRKLWFSISSLLVVTSFVLLGVFGLRLNIDFTGGSLLEVEYVGVRPDITLVREALEEVGYTEGQVQPSDEQGLLVREPVLTEDQHQEVLGVLKTFGEVDELRFDSIGPVIGQELKKKSVTAILLIFIAIILYVAWAFRKVSHFVQSWKYGVLTVVAALHDVIIPIGVFALLGHLFEFSVGTAFVAALLTILGYSVNDTIVVFDRVRENLLDGNDDFEETVNKSINQTIARSINTTVTTLLALLAVFFFGGETTREFILALMVGIASGAYSSVFLASPLLVVWEKMSR